MPCIQAAGFCFEYGRSGDRLTHLTIVSVCKQPSENAFSQQLISWIQDALSAESFRFDYRHYVETTGWSAFRLDVMDALCQVPTGKRITYSQLAEHAGYPWR